MERFLSCGLLALPGLRGHHVNRQVGPGRAKQLVLRLPGSVASDVSLPDGAGAGVVEQVGVVVARVTGVGGLAFRGPDLSDGSGDDLVEVCRELVELRELLPSVHADDEGILGRA